MISAQANQAKENQWGGNSSTPHVDLPDGTEVDFYYDGMGRRLKKVITDGTDITTIKYHYIGGQITTIEIDAEDDEVAYRDETLHIHLGPNSYILTK